MREHIAPAPAQRRAVAAKARLSRAWCDELCSKAVQWSLPGLVISKAVGYRRANRKRTKRLMCQMSLAAQKLNDDRNPARM